MELTLEQLKQETCKSYGGNNCVLHQCMFSCILKDAIKKAEKKLNLSNNTQTHKELCNKK